jgi:hypothetical protein
VPHRRGQHGLAAGRAGVAASDDGAVAPDLAHRLEGQPVGKVRRVFADSKYHNYALYEWVEANAPWELVIVRRPEGKKG